MKRPNKIERMHAYLYAWAILMDRIENPNDIQKTNCVCPMLREYYQQTTLDRSYKKSIEFLYPEYAKQRPQDDYSRWYWWSDDDKQSRITALENAIKLLDNNSI